MSPFISIPFSKKILSPTSFFLQTSASIQPRTSLSSLAGDPIHSFLFASVVIPAAAGSSATRRTAASGAQLGSALTVSWLRIFPYFPKKYIFGLNITHANVLIPVLIFISDLFLQASRKYFCCSARWAARGFRRSPTPPNAD